MPPSPPRHTPRRMKQIKQEASAFVSQCKDCRVWKCNKQELMAQSEIFAETNNQPKPECEDYEPGFWERMAI